MKQEMVLVVDEANRPIAPLSRSEVHTREAYHWHRCSHVVVMNKDKKILCHQRSLQKKAGPGMWNAFFGGHTDPQETDESCAKKELREETSIVTNEVQHLCTYKSVETKEFQSVYVCFWNGDTTSLTLQQEEVEQVRWFAIDELVKKLKTSDWSVMGWEEPVLHFLNAELPIPADFESVLNESELETFDKKVSNYVASKSTSEQFRKLRVCALVGPAGSGKDSIREYLLATHPTVYEKLLSDTTRSPRIGEIEANNYVFKSKADVLKGINNQEYLQTALIHNQQVSGLHLDQVNDAKGRIALAILVIASEKELRELNQQLRTVFLIPPDIHELLRRLHEGRTLTMAEIERRLQSAKKEITEALAQPEYMFVITTTPEDCGPIIHDYFNADRFDPTYQARARATAQQLHVDLEKHL
jgi:guanylate kinase